MSRAHLHALGFSNAQIRSREANGELHELYTDVWAVGRPNVTPLGRLIAALLSCGPTAFLSHRTAAALHGLRQTNVHAIEVTVVGQRASARRGLITHRTAKPLAPKDLRTVGHLHYSSVPRMLIGSPRAKRSPSSTASSRKRPARNSSSLTPSRRPSVGTRGGRAWHVSRRLWPPTVPVRTVNPTSSARSTYG